MYYAIAALVVGLVILVAGIIVFRSSYNNEGWGMLISGVGGFTAFCAALPLIVIPIGYHFDTVECQTFEKQTGYETRMVRYYWGSWTCLAKAEDGRWLPKNQLRDLND